MPDLVKYDPNGILLETATNALWWYPHEELTTDDLNDAQWLGYYVDIPEGESITALGVTSGGLYFSVDGGCDYTGWDCQSHADWYTSKDFQDVIDNGMTNEMRGLLGFPRPTPRVE